MARQAILVVDYSSEIRELVVSVLDGAGYEVLQADSAADALDLVRNRAVDLVVCNIVAPGLDGIQLMLAAQDIRPDLRVLLTTGHVRETESAGREPAAAAAFEQPFRPDSLISEVRRILSDGKR